ncbi:MAG TPA: hypothetical protein DEP03_08140 [Massilia sp.]|nr:hypothetical protein [Massilia sp.]
MADLGRLVVNLEANIARFTADMSRAAEATEKTMDRMNAAADQVKNVLGFLGVALTFDALVGEVNRAVDGLARLDDMIQKTGASAEMLSKLGKVAAFTGTDIGTVDGMIVKLAKNMATADEKGSKFAKAMAALGLSIDGIEKRDPAQQFVDIANALQDYEDGAGKAAIMTDLINKSAAEMLPYMNDVAESLNDFTGESAEAAAAAAKYQDDLGRMKVKYDEVATSIVKDALPAMTDFVGGISDGIKESRELTGIAVDSWADDTAVGLARVVDVAVLLPRLLSTIGGSFKAVGADIEFLVTAAVTASPQAIARSLAQGINPIETIRTALEERNAVVDEANRKLDDLWNKPANTMEQAVLARINARREAEAAAGADAMAGLLPGAGPAPEKRKTLKYGGGNDDGGAAASALQARIAGIERAYKEEQDQLVRHERAMNELRGQGLIGFEYYNEARLTAIDAARDAAVRAYNAEITALEGARAKAKDAAARDAIDLQIKDKGAAKEKALRDAQAARTQELLEQGAAQSALTREMEAWSRQQDQATSQLQFSNDLYGKSALEVEKLTNARRAQLEVDEKIRRAQQQGAISQDAIDRFRKEAKDKADAANNAATKGVGMGLIQSLESPMESENRNHANVLRDLQAYRDQELADTMAANQAIESENQRHQQAMLEMRMQANMLTVQMAGDSSAQLYNILQQAGMEQTALGKALFVANKAIAVAEIIMNTELAAAKALAMGPVVGPIMAGVVRGMGYASAGIVIGTTIASAEGGYDIPAGENPVTQLHEKEMVLPKAQAEVIRGLAANGGAGGRGAVSVTYSPNFNIDSRSDRAQVQRDMQMVAQQANADLVDRLQRAGRI